MKKEELIARLKEPNGPEKLSGEKNILKDVLDLVSGTSVMSKETGPALALLIRLGKQKKAGEEINERISQGQMEAWLKADDPKTRKNAARLIGTLRRREMSGPLIQALNREGTRMVVPSMLLSLGALKTPDAISALKAYEVRPPENESEMKHVREEKEALKKALGSLPASSVHVFAEEIWKDRLLCLQAGEGMEKALAREVEQQKAGVILRVAPGSVTVKAVSWQLLKKVRSYREILFPLGTVRVKEGEANEDDLKDLSKAAANCLEETHRKEETEETAFRFRLETDRSKAARMAAMIEAADDRLINAAGSYECEIRLWVGSHAHPFTGKSMGYLKLFTAEDHRFDYRKETIAASIHPANAAALMQMASPYLTKGAVVLEPCCGSGTMFLERMRVRGKEPGEIVGLDIEEGALIAAERNVRASQQEGCGVRVHLAHGDMLRFEMPEGRLADELIANLPFGNRVGSHKINEQLYEGLFDRMPRWIRKGGIALLYSMEAKLMLEEARRSEHVKILHMTRVEAGGLKPMVMILEIK